jgi:hypothetical protein
LLLWAAWPAFGFANKQAAIDSYCQQLKDEFREVSPYFFSGPNPWRQLAQWPAEFSDTALALVYTDGGKVRWVEMHLSEEGWYERVDYYFAEDGIVVKRERHFEEQAANLEMNESRYYLNGKRWKDQMQHHALGQGKEDLSQLFDPQAPEYLNTGELPFPPVAFAPFALLRVPDVLKPAKGLSNAVQ